LISEPSKELIENCQKGDLESFKRLYRHYERTIFGFCYRMLNNRQDTEDAVQTIFLNLYRGIGKYRFKAGFSTYLFSITRNVCFDMLKSQKVVKENLDEAKNISVNPMSVNHDIAKAISRLPQKTRECFILFAVEGFPQDEIAELLNIKSGTVKALIFQARQKLVAWLADEEE
jgi:RNA polymerase sigma-70 factor (ECF subfamily)